MRIAMIQMEVIGGAKEWNISRAFSLMERAAARADVLVLPELWTCGYDFKTLPAEAVRMGDALTAALSDFARSHHVTLAAGTVPVMIGGKLYNRSLIYGADGTLLGSYSKHHLFDGYIEGELMTPGDALLDIKIGGISCGMGICYELYFPGMFRRMAKRGTTLFLVPASWPLTHIRRWKILAKARALENGAYVCAVNTVGSYHGVTLGGHSLFIDPEGEVLAEGDEAEGIFCGEYDEEKYPDLGRGLAVIHPEGKREG